MLNYNAISSNWNWHDTSNTIKFFEKIIPLCMKCILLAWMHPSIPWVNPWILTSGLTGDEFRFNKDNGDGPARYNIIHYKQVSNGKYEWITVGEFHHDVIQGDVMHLNMSGT